MKKCILPLLVALTFLVPAFASPVDPRSGHYVGEGTTKSGVHKTVTFDFEGQRILDLRIAGKRFPQKHFTTSGHSYYFYFHHTFDEDSYVGHGVWHENLRSSGLFYFTGDGEKNITYTWHAHWKHY